MNPSQSGLLIIDDEPGIRAGCRRVLEPAGYLVDTAETLAEGLQKILAGHFEMVLLDVMLPDGRGIDLLAGIQQQDPDIVVVIITGYATVELAVQAIRQGAYDFISKPFSADALLMTVGQGLEKRQLSQQARRAAALEKENCRQAMALAEAEKLAEFKAHYAYVVAHELRSPIGGAQSLLRTLTQGLAGDLAPNQREILERVDARLSQLLNLVNDLLALAGSRTLQEKKTRMLLCPVLLRLYDQYQVEAKTAGLKLIFPVQAAEDIWVEATEIGLLKILGNLLSNAIKYTPSGGEVRVEARRLENSIQVMVIDSGIGIPDAVLSRIGEEFYRAPNAKRAGISGTGLGMSIVFEYVKAYGGSVQVDSQEGKGTTVTVTLPLAPPGLV